MEDDFTFPTVDAPAPPLVEAGERQGIGEVPFPGRLPPAGTTSFPLWPFSSSPSSSPGKPATRHVRATTVDHEEEAPPSRRGGRVVPVRQRAEADDIDEDLMDMLWEDFNDVEHRAGSATDGGGYRFPRSSTPPSSDADSEESSTSPGRRHGCAPTMLRASSRAGGAGHFCASTRRSRKTTGWALLMRLFRRLFAVDKTTRPSRSRRRCIYGAP